MAYVSQTMKKELAPTIKAILKKYGIKGSLAVRNHSTLVLNINSGNIDFIKNYLDTTGWGRRCNPSHFLTKDMFGGYLQVNTYHIDSQYSGKARDFLNEVIAAMKGPNFYDRSDAMTDYFDVSHYVDINVGKWNKPYIVTNN